MYIDREELFSIIFTQMSNELSEKILLFIIDLPAFCFQIEWFHPVGNLSTPLYWIERYFIAFNFLVLPTQYGLSSSANF